MAIRVALNHKTEYRFDRPVNVFPHVVRLRPSPHSRTPIHAYSLKTSPKDHFINWQQDPFGNYLARFVFSKKTRMLSFEVDLIAEMTVINPFDFFLEEAAEKYPWNYEPGLASDLAPYLEIEEQGPLLKKWLEGVDRSVQPTVDFLVAINQSLQRDVGYTLRMEPGVQTCEETLSKRIGSCRDSAWLLVQILRHLGFAARFVSGYLVQLTADVKPLEGPSGPQSDFTDLHAWAEAFLPGAGWVGLDPTSGLFAGEGHIPLAATPEPSSAAPITGATEPCEVEFYFHNKVTRIHEDPRVTKPYTDQQWDAVVSLGDAVDRVLEEKDVRLTMGGEPTFVSIDDMDGEQWNTAALGEDKRRLAGELLLKLKDRFATGAMLQYGQGKWYPGEPLPRWSLSCFWRTDATPLWKDNALLADELKDYGFGAKEAQRFIQTLAGHLGVEADCAVPAYEDVFYTLWQEGSLPENIDPFEMDLGDDLERKRLLAQLDSGLEQVSGYALPIGRDAEAFSKDAWRTSQWKFRRGRMYLVPGDSPMGLRLPLGSLPWISPELEEADVEADPFEERQDLGDAYAGVAARAERVRETGGSVGASRRGQVEQRKPARKKVPQVVLHTALCVEPRNGRLYVFLPPVSRLEHAVDLIASVELTASKLNMPVVLEGYPPPADPRLKKFQITPDPGVIEVNVQPAASWRELIDITETLYHQAHQTRLGTEKFMLDGRHSGTGGGNHVTLGGATTVDSPVLRRPDLLRSLVTYWQHHPSLSYLFSGAFIGPTSQAPRVDEARHESLYELEIAFEQLEKHSPALKETSKPWIVDRTLRHLLADMTGNTHRAEFCIDKLYSPEGPAGRLGLVEFRGFEMPPHARMSAVQMLLLRTLLAHFWEKPFDARPVRWGTALHDRFMLPHFVWADFESVIEDLGRAGYPLELDWFAPFREFRFPHYGTVQVAGIELSLHWAIEPWHVLAEEISSQGTSRFVDSSLERLQVSARNLAPGRHAILCNGRRVPLIATGVPGDYVGGVRYKAWRPPSGLHPTIEVQAPLTFDVVDVPNRRSIGGCSYHVSHPGGRNFETFPVNANEAEARRFARFWSHGHTPREMDVPAEERNPDYPCTLDLRHGAL
ncbi:MAG: transglutaminase family protein [Gammaproteobacteria bacterium]|nr:transglutaminase family protein [Gammaproteobacteria bacterium]